MEFWNEEIKKNLPKIQQQQQLFGHINNDKKIGR